MKITIKTIIILLILTLFINSGSAFADTIKVGIYENMPLVGVDEEGTPIGFFVDVFNYIAKKEKWDISYELDSFDNNMKKVENGEIDILLVVAWSSERDQIYIYNKETIYSNWGQVYSNIDEKIESVLDLEGKKIGVEKGDIHYIGNLGIKNMLDDFNVKVNYIEYPNRIEMLRDLENKIIDAGVVSRVYGEYYESNYDIKITPIQFNPIKTKIVTVDEKNQYILDRIDENLLDMKADNKSIYNTAMSSFLSNDAKSGLSRTTLRYIYTILVALFLAIVAVIISRKELSRQNRNIEKQNKQLKYLIDSFTRLTYVQSTSELFETFIKSMKYIMDSDEIELVILLKGKKLYVLDDEEYIEGSYKKYAKKNVENVKFKYINKEILDEFIMHDEEIKFYDKFLLAKFISTHNLPCIVYIETDGKKIDEEIVSVYIYGIFQTLKTITINITKEKEQKEMIISLGEIIEKRDHSVSNHVKRVSLASKLLAKEFGYSDDDLNNIEIAASIHDIGKILVPDSILNKPGKLTTEEFNIVKKHTTSEFLVFKDFELKLFDVVKNVVRYHHENWDGTGYQNGLKGDEIPLEARIISVIDVFDALMHKRSYKEAWPIKGSLEFIEISRGVKFDPEVVDKFMDIKDKIIEIFKKYPEYHK